MNREEWVVQLELVGDQQVSREYEGFGRLIEELRDCTPGLLHSAGRYAVLLRLIATTSLEAHRLALTRWQDAVRQVLAFEWAVARVEVVTADEFARDCALLERNEHLRDEHAGDNTLGEDLLRSVFVDPVTHLPTAEAFRARLHEVLSRHQPPGCSQAVLVLEIERGKPSAPRARESDDGALLEVVEQLAVLTRPSDSVARVGRETLALLVQDIPQGNVMSLGERALQAMTGGPGNDQGPASGSVGIALAQPGYDADRLLASAHAALDIAKRGGGGRWVLFQPGEASAPRPRAPFYADPTGERSSDSG